VVHAHAQTAPDCVDAHLKPTKVTHHCRWSSAACAKPRCERRHPRAPTSRQVRVASATRRSWQQCREREDSQRGAEAEGRVLRSSPARSLARSLSRLPVRPRRPAPTLPVRARERASGRHSEGVEMVPLCADWGGADHLRLTRRRIICSSSSFLPVQHTRSCQAHRDQPSAIFRPPACARRRVRYLFSGPSDFWIAGFAQAQSVPSYQVPESIDREIHLNERRRDWTLY